MTPLKSFTVLGLASFVVLSAQPPPRANLYAVHGRKNSKTCKNVPRVIGYSPIRLSTGSQWAETAP